MREDICINVLILREQLTLPDSLTWRPLPRFFVLQENHLHLIDMAAFMGLACSPDQAFKVWQLHSSESSRGDYTTHDLPGSTIEWMNATMSRLLPPNLALHWGLAATEL